MALKQRLDFLFVLPLDLLDPKASLIKAIEANTGAFLIENRLQMDRGLDSEGKSLGTYKRFSYKNRFQPVDLLKEGPFRRKMTVQVNDIETRIFSQDEKEGKLVAKYGKDIFGVPDEALPKIAKKLKPLFIEDVRRKLKKL